MQVGVIALQGAVSEHQRALDGALEALGRSGTVITIRTLEQLREVDAAVLPGGESTTIGKLLQKFGLARELIRRCEEGMPLLGTCAGAILMAKEGDGQVERTRTPLLQLMDIAVDRNAFGRQRESFQLPVDVRGWATPFPGVFIRAPLITRVWGRAEALALMGGGVVFARQGHLLASAFHPELSDDLRVHQLLVSMV